MSACLIQLISVLKRMIRRKEEQEEMLAVPRVWINYPLAPPPPPEEMLANREIYEAALGARRFKSRPGPEDSSTLTLYRIYEAIVLDSVCGLRNEIEYFFRRSTWAVCDIPDPADDDPARYAVFACIPYLLVTAFNHNIKLGLPRTAPAIMSDEKIVEVMAMPKIYERVPKWAESVAPLSRTLVLPHHPTRTTLDLKVLSSFDDPDACEVFKAKNILTWVHHILFI